MGEIVHNRDADVNDTVQLIVDIINREASTPFVKDIAKNILAKSTTKEDVLRNLFDYVCAKVNYRLDPKGFERVATPRRLIADGVGDCKKMTVFIASVLKCLGIACTLRVISYDGENYEHIYVIVPMSKRDYYVPIAGVDYITLDPVNDKQYNAELAHKKHSDIYLENKDMVLSELNGKPSPTVRFDITDSPDNYNTDTRFLSQLCGMFDFNTQPTANSRFLNYLGNYNTQPTAESRFLNYLGKPANDFYDDLNGICGIGDDFWGQAFDTIKHISNGGIDILIDNIREKGLTEGLSSVLDRAGKEFDKATLVFKTINGAGTRVAFAVAVSVNFSNIAGDLYAGYVKDKAKLINWWEQDMGGQWSDLKDAINKGLQESGKSNRVNGMGAMAASTAAAIVAAAGVIASALALLKDMNVVSPQAASGISNTVADALSQFKATAQANGLLPKSDLMTYAPYILGGALLIYALK